MPAGAAPGRFADDPNGKGGVRLAKSIDEVAPAADAMLGHDAGHQADRPGRAATVQRVYVEAGCDIKRELYLSLLVDRATGAHHHHRLDRGRHGDRGGGGATPRRRSSRVAIDPATGFRPSRPQARLRAGPRRQAGRRLRQIRARRCTRPSPSSTARIVEINPLVVTGGGRGDRARCQDELRRQRAVPPPGPRGAARRGRGGPDRDSRPPSTR